MLTPYGTTGSSHEPVEEFPQIQLQRSYPEGFSPNGDGYNDRFVILGIKNFPNNELMIFNRQGVELFHRVNYENDWDGRPESGSILGGVLPEGTYYYIFKFGELNIRKGTIYLNRE